MNRSTAAAFVAALMLLALASPAVAGVARESNLPVTAEQKAAGLAPSTSEASRLIEGGGVRVDSGVVSDKGLKLDAGTYVVQVGKRKFARVTLA